MSLFLCFSHILLDDIVKMLLKLKGGWRNRYNGKVDHVRGKGGLSIAGGGSNLLQTIRVFTTILPWAGGKEISPILRNEEVWTFFWGGGARWEGCGKCLDEGSGVLEIAIINFTSWTLFDLLFTCRLKDVVSLVVFNLCF